MCRKSTNLGKSLHKTVNICVADPIETPSPNNNNNNNNTHDNVYSAVIMTTGHCESSLGTFDECRTAPSGRRPSDQAA